MEIGRAKPDENKLESIPGQALEWRLAPTDSRRFNDLRMTFPARARLESKPNQKNKMPSSGPEGNVGGLGFLRVSRAN